MQTFGFSEKQIQNAFKALSEPSVLSATLLSSFEPLQACLEYLILHLPECDLPQRFLPSSNSSNPFVSSIHAGTDDLKTRWIEDKAVKECGWPAHVVKDLLTDRKFVESWALLQQALNRVLLGRTEDDISDELIETEPMDEDELQAYEARFIDNSHLLVPLPVAPLQLHIILHSDEKAIPVRGEPPGMYITSTTVPAYARLHILSELLTAFLSNTLVDPGESVVMAAVRFIEEQWASIQDNGPPEMSHVLRHFLRRHQTAPKTDDADLGATTTQQYSKGRGPRPSNRRDGRSSEIIKAEFEKMRQSKSYSDILVARKRLPAFAAQKTFLELLAANRCVVVVGETGKPSEALRQR